ncbi:unnamed protein product [Ilex paraguariensis]|uniref:Transmembrane protein n=1 Tax=Ilex paraguariensis TaxID=185542 RepID=A0ABC8URM7_9AQUA
MNMRTQDQQTRVFYELCSMIIHILGSPPLPTPFPSLLGSSVSSSWSQASPTAFASLFLGISLALMLFGSVTFLIGFILMPCVVGLVLLFYFVGIVQNLSELGRAFLCPAASGSHKDVHARGDVNTNGDEKDGNEAKEEDGVDKDRNSTRLHGADTPTLASKARTTPVLRPLAPNLPSALSLSPLPASSVG